MSKFDLKILFLVLTSRIENPLIARSKKSLDLQVNKNKSYRKMYIRKVLELNKKIRENNADEYVNPIEISQ